MAAQLIESELKQPVERVMADIGIQYQSVARGDLDLMLMAWLPGTHRDYWGKVRDQVLISGRCIPAAWAGSFPTMCRGR